MQSGIMKTSDAQRNEAKQEEKQQQQPRQKSKKHPKRKRFKNIAGSTKTNYPDGRNRRQKSAVGNSRLPARGTGLHHQQGKNHLKRLLLPHFHILPTFIHSPVPEYRSLSNFHSGGAPGMSPIHIQSSERSSLTINPSGNPA